ncbi:MAG: GNAT family N-acetyltransferase, partial [Gemmatimonadales bacterium]
NWAKLYRSAERLPPPGGALRVELIGAERAELFAAIVVESFAWPELLRPWLAAAVGRPGWRHYVALDRGAPVGAAALFFQGDTGWMGFAATLPTARGRGAQTALITRRLHDGTALGCRWFVVETAEDRPDAPSPSHRNVRRLGFEMAYLRPNWVLSWSAPDR